MNTHKNDSEPALCMSRIRPPDSDPKRIRPGVQPSEPVTLCTTIHRTLCRLRKSLVPPPIGCLLLAIFGSNGTAPNYYPSQPVQILGSPL